MKKKKKRVDTDTDTGCLPDGSGYAVVSFPLPSDHWLYRDEGYEPPPMPMRVGTSDPRRAELAEQIRMAARWAIRGATMRGKEANFDPDALIQLLIVGLLGYWTPDGLGSEDWTNPPLQRDHHDCDG